MFIFWTLLGAIIANVLYVYISFEDSVRNDFWKIYTYGVFASALAAISWIYLIRHLSHRHIFFANFAWDITVTILCAILPIFMYGVRLDTKAVLGCILATIGIILIHLGDAQ